MRAWPCAHLEGAVRPGCVLWHDVFSHLFFTFCSIIILYSLNVYVHFFSFTLTPHGMDFKKFSLALAGMAPACEPKEMLLSPQGQSQLCKCLGINLGLPRSYWDVTAQAAVWPQASLRGSCGTPAPFLGNRVSNSAFSPGYMNQKPTF